MTALTVGDLMEYLRPRATGAPRWPPDAFALAASILRHADAYREVVGSWPPREYAHRPDEWRERIQGVGARWRAASTTRRGGLPEPIARWWKCIERARRVRIKAVARDRALCEALLQLVSAADEASARAGVWEENRKPDEFSWNALRRLLLRDSLAKEIDPTRAVVFPKFHTPQRGITSRSLTHYLALHEPKDVIPSWFAFPRVVRSDFAFNLLVLPWPAAVTPSEFRATAGPLLNMPSRYGFFTFESAAAKTSVKRVAGARAAAERIVGHVDAIAFPELALAPGMCEALAEKLGVTVIGGEGSAPRSGNPGTNHAVVAMPLGPSFAATYRQSKHHRWCLDASQIEAYGLGGQLDPSKEWWEHIEIKPRELHFFGVNEWLNFCVLICEDLARQDPVSQLIRAVGPNLVVALLMDGPQLERRWPAKYATVLAEDPGSSVLTLTSIGMSVLSRPPGTEESRVIALWKDAFSRAVEITLDRDSIGAVLCLTRRRVEEHAADGRGDGGTADYIRLHGVHQVPRDA